MFRRSQIGVECPDLCQVAGVVGEGVVVLGVELEPLGCLADAVGHGRLTASRSGVSNSEKVGVVEGVLEG